MNQWHRISECRRWNPTKSCVTGMDFVDTYCGYELTISNRYVILVRYISRLLVLNIYEFMNNQSQKNFDPRPC